MLRLLILAGTHGAMLAAGFALGVYFLPILTAPASVDKAMLAATSQAATYQAEFKRGLKGNDFLHWGEGKISLTAQKVVHQGTLAPGPDYKLYLTKQFVEDEEQFEKIKNQSRRIGDIKTFDGFLIDIPEGVDIEDYNSVVVWCEAFGEFITAAKYK